MLGITQSEYAERRKKVLNAAHNQKADCVVLFGAKHIQYYTGARLIATERPIVLLLLPNEKTAMLVPRLELEHIESHAKIDFVHTYHDYPGTEHPMDVLAKLLHEFAGSGKTIAVDRAGHGGWGYHGPTLQTICPHAHSIDIGTFIEKEIMIKSPAEIALIKESARLCNYAHALLQEKTKEGRHELAVVDEVKAEVCRTMITVFGKNYVFGADAVAMGYRGQIGARSYFPHALSANCVFKKGDTAVTGAGIQVCGYMAELERVFFIGEPETEKVHYYQLALQAQQLALSAIKPGIPCSAVDNLLGEFYRSHNIEHCLRHHTGHSLGLDPHEAPFFDVGDHTVLESGMIFSVEPGIYVEKVGGFRLSDTVAVTAEGAEILTDYPTDIESLICK